MLFILFQVVATEKSLTADKLEEYFCVKESLFEMPPRKSTALRKRLSEMNAARRWSVEKTVLAATIDGENGEFAGEADNTAIDSARQIATAGAGATAQLPGVSQTASCAASRKIETVKALKSDATTGQHELSSRDWCIVDASQLTEVIADVACPACHNVGALFVVKGGLQAMGFAESIHLECTHCPYTGSCVYSSPRIGDSAKQNVPFEINSLMTMLVHELGKGHEALQTVQKVLGMNNMHVKTYQRHHRSLQQACQSVADANMNTAAEVIRGVYGDLMDDDGIIDMTVNYDGTWQKRGFTSHHGVGVAIEVQTGLVVDYEVLSNYCHACALAENKFGTDTAALHAWQAAHTACDRNFGGSSKAMEAEAARRIWSRSVEMHAFRYEYILSDGDSSTFAALTRLQLYGPAHPVKKLDCMNHAEKRMGTSLRKAAKLGKLGGHGAGRLTQTKAADLQAYYGRALRRNVGNVEETKDAVWASLFHSLSTNDDSHHQRCPHGPDSWCVFNKSAALGLAMPTHDIKTVGTLLDRDVAQELIPIYQWMTDDNLLARMTTGGTQNANESLNSVIWLYCPKTQFVGHRKVVSAVQSAVCRFNGGATATTERMRYLGIQPTEMQMGCMVKTDQCRVQRAMRAADNSAKKMRKDRQTAQKRTVAALEAGEGLQYAAGEF